MLPVVVFDDLELFLTDWLRAALDARTESYAQDVIVAAVEPGPLTEFPDRLVTFRIDGGLERSVVSAAVSVAVNVYAGTKQLPQDAIDLARLVHALLRSAPAVEIGNPLVAVDEITTPYRVSEEQSRARLFFTITYVVWSETTL